MQQYSQETCAREPTIAGRRMKEVKGDEACHTMLTGNLSGVLPPFLSYQVMPRRSKMATIPE